MKSKFISLYERGIITKTTAICQLVESDPCELPSPWLELVREHIDKLPADDDDEDWNRMLYLFGGTSREPSTADTQNECRARARLRTKAWREFYDSTR